MMFGFRRAACIVLAATAISAVNSFAVTSQFRGVNWADKRDNFVSDILNNLFSTRTEPTPRTCLVRCGGNANRSGFAKAPGL